MFMETAEDHQKAEYIQENFKQRCEGTRTVELSQVFAAKSEQAARSFEINSGATFGADRTENFNCKGHSVEEGTDLQSVFLGSAAGLLCDEGAAAVSLMVRGSWAAKDYTPLRSPEDIKSPSSPPPPPPQLHLKPGSARAVAPTAVEISCSLEYGVLPLNAITKLGQPS